MSVSEELALIKYILECQNRAHFVLDTIIDSRQVFNEVILILASREGVWDAPLNKSGLFQLLHFGRGCFRWLQGLFPLQQEPSRAELLGCLSLKVRIWGEG